MTADPMMFATRARELLAAPLDAAGVPAFLVSQDELSRDLFEAYARLSRAKDADTTDEAARAAFLEFVTKVLPEMQVLSDAFSRKLLAVDGYEPRDDLAVAWDAMRGAVELFREENVPLMTRDMELGQQYEALTGALVAKLDGEEVTLDAAQAKLESTDRSLRERAFRAVDDAKETVREGLNGVFAELMAVRHQTATNAGCADYREYMWRSLRRTEYTPDDCLELHAAVEEVVVPRLREVYGRRREQMGLDALRPYDLGVDARGREPLVSFRDIAEFEEKLTRLFGAVHPEIAERFEVLRDGWLDIESRPGKVPGVGYQSYFAKSRRPFIYMNAVGTDDDLLTMRHEVGHALHSFRAQERWPLLMQMPDRSEINELASQSLEFLTLPHLEGIFYDAEDAQRSKAALLVRALALLVQVAKLDSMQHWIYTHPSLASGTGPTAAELDAQWLKIVQRFDVGLDYSGFERGLSRGWQYFHLFRAPFYYVEYAIAYLGALQVWEFALRDQDAALAAYLEALSLGGTRPLDELYAAAGVKFAFDRGTVERMVGLVVRELGEEA